MRLMILPLIAVFLLLPACPPPRVPCDERTGGAMITFQVVDDQITLWIENDEFIDEALTLEGQGVQRVPNFHRVIAGTDCDAQWSWHVHPRNMEWADVTIELCDGVPSHIEANRNAWIREVGGWCPWSAEVIAVDDRR